MSSHITAKENEMTQDHREMSENETYKFLASLPYIQGLEDIFEQNNQGMWQMKADIKAKSDAIKETRALARSQGSNMAVVHNLDGERDDTLWASHVLGERALKTDGVKAQYIFVAGEQTGGKRTYESLEGLASRLLNCDGSESTSSTLGEHVNYKNASVDVVLGAPVLGKKKAERRALRANTSFDGTLSDPAATRLMSVIGDKEFLFNSCTSTNLFDALPPKALQQCLQHTITCSLVFAKHKLITGMNINWAEEEFDRTVASCNKHGIPLLLIHASTMGSNHHTMSELVGWGDQVSKPRVDTTAVRDDIAFSMGKATEWIGRHWAAALGKVEADFTSIIKASLQDLLAGKTDTEREFQEEQWKEWTTLLMRDNNYVAYSCEKGEISKRTDAIWGQIEFGLAGTVGDYGLAVPEDGEMSKEIFWLPVASIERGRTSRLEEGVKQIKLHNRVILGKDDASSMFVACGVIGDGMNKIYAQDMKTQSTIHDINKNSAKYSYVVDSDFANRWSHFVSLQSHVLGETIKACVNSGWEGPVGSLERARQSLESGLMSSLVKEFLAGHRQ